MMFRILNFFKLNKWALFSGALSGVLVGTSYIPFPPWALFFCYAPLWFFALRNLGNWRQILLAGWVAQFVLTLIGFHWIAYVAHEFGFMPWPFAIATLLLFAAAMHIYIPLSLVFGTHLSRKLNLSKGATLLVFASLLSLTEQFWPSIFNWNMGYTLLWTRSPLAQWADVVGFVGLSFAIYLLNAWAVFLLETRNRKAIGISMALMPLLLGSAFWIGTEKAHLWARTDSELKALLVQANIGNAEKIYAERGAAFQQAIADQFFTLTRDGLAQFPDAELIVWPESAYPDYLDSFARSRKYSSQLYSFAQSIQKPLMTGAFSKDPPNPLKSYQDEYNAVFLFNEKGEPVSEAYHKTQLLIFGEYIPFGREFPWLAKLNPGGVGWGRGSGPTTLELNGNRYGIQICYESLDPLFSTKLAQKGANLLVNVTNDSWFGPRGEPYQHLYMTFARAIETRLPLIRATNTGISSVILADGTVLEQSPLFEKWVGLFSVKFQKNPEPTFYTRFGSWLSGAIFVFLLLTLAIGRNRARILSSRLE